MTTAIEILVVDDSAVVREAMTALLAGASDLHVTTAADPLVAMTKMKLRRPDVIVLDIEMPRMDGLTFLKKLMSEDPLPVVICSHRAAQGSDVAFQALDAGAVAIITKPKLDVRGFFEDSASFIVETIRGAAQAQLPSRARDRPARPSRPPPDLAAHRTADAARRDPIIAIGASLGGPEALRIVLEALPADFPGTLVVQHMPAGFTTAFAKRLHDGCRLAVREAADGDRVERGVVLLAPGNRHMEVARSGGGYVVELSDGPLVSRHRPSVDVLFRSVAQVCGKEAIGLIMTGMGDDGARGLLAMRQAGALTLAQDRESCVVYGMPNEAVRSGAVEETVPLAELAGALMVRVRKS